MLTRCPHCETTFRVTPEQLKARQGKVRCGECQQVFNALDTLIEAPPAATPPAAEEPTVFAEQAATAAPAILEAAETGDPSEARAGEREDTDAAAAEPEPAPAVEVASEPTEPASEPANEPWPEATLAAEKRRRWPWALGGVAALLTLLVQAAMHFRTEITVLYPAARPALAAACEALACKLLLPRKAELMSIESSHLHPEANGQLALAATLKNRAPFAQEYPHLELTLTDTADKPLLRRVLAPADYLPKSTAAAGGIAVGKEVGVDLLIEAPGVPAAGYRLYLFYP